MSSTLTSTFGGVPSLSANLSAICAASALILVIAEEKVSFTLLSMMEPAPIITAQAIAPAAPAIAGFDMVVCAHTRNLDALLPCPCEDRRQMPPQIRYALS